MDLFSQSPDERLAASSTLPDSGSTGLPGLDSSNLWPFGNYGAANAWLALVGPSPGAPPKSDLRDTFKPTVGPQSGFFGFSDKPNRNRTWFSLAESGFGPHGGPRHRTALCALMNLVGDNESNAAMLDENMVADGVTPCVARLKACRAIVVIALEHRVYRLLAPAFANASIHVTSFNGPPNRHSAARKPLEAVVCHWHWQGQPTDTIIIQSPQHPSRPQRLTDGVSSMSEEGARLRYEVVRESVGAFQDQYL